MNQASPAAKAAAVKAACILLSVPTLCHAQGGIITTVAGNGALGQQSGDGGLATHAGIGGPAGVAVDTAGNFYIADSFNSRIRKVNSSGIISTYAGGGAPTSIGDGGPATSAQLANPEDVVMDSSGNLYIDDVGNESIRKVTKGVITSILGPGFGSCAAGSVPAAHSFAGTTAGLGELPE